MGTMFDTASDPGATFSGLSVEAVAAYGNGKFANYTRAKQQFPNAHILQIDVSGQGIGDTGDFEPGDMRYSRAGSWAKQRLAAGVKRPDEAPPERGVSVAPGRRDGEAEHHDLHAATFSFRLTTLAPQSPITSVLTEAGPISKRRIASSGRPRW